jgi:hypothetical protein
MDAKRLGVSFDDLLGYRLMPHAWGWLVGVGGAIWLALFLGMPLGDVWENLFFSACLAFLIVLVYGFACMLWVPALPLVLLAFLSIAVEAWWRIRYDLPYVLPPSLPDPPEPRAPAPRQCDGLVPLLIGLWIGSTWGSDD